MSALNLNRSPADFDFEFAARSSACAEAETARYIATLWRRRVANCMIHTREGAEFTAWEPTLRQAVAAEEQAIRQKHRAVFSPTGEEG